MKILRLFIWAALALVSCSRELDIPDEQPAAVVDVEGMPVTITFSVAGPPVDVSTKVDGDGLDSDFDGGLETLHLAVFGGSGYLKDYVEAKPLNKALPTNYYSYTVDKQVQKTDDEGNRLYYKYTTNEEGEDNVDYGSEVTKEELGELEPDYPVLVMKKCERKLPVYTYTVTLPLSTSRRTIHFLGNGPSTLPFGWASDVIPVQLSQLRKYTETGSEEEKSLKSKAYWQMLDLPDGITAKKKTVGTASYYVSKNGKLYGRTKEEDAEFMADGGFQIEDNVNAMFSMIPLVRNWAKVVLYSLPKRQSHFEAISMAVVNVPSRGSLAPYSAATEGFVQGYEMLGFDDLQKMKYPASLPAKTVFDNSIPDASEFVPDPGNPEQFKDGSRVARASTLEVLYSENDTDESAVYMYERPAPSDKIPPSYVIIYGKYFEDPNDPNDEGYPCYYKVDLMETVDVLDDEGHETGIRESRYYPIYRNFKYQIWISKILSKGHATPQAAANSAGSADVSADVTTGHLSDISDGEGRLHLTWMAKTYTNTEDYPETTLDVFYSDPSGEPYMGTSASDTYYVTAELLPPADNKGDLIDKDSVEIMDPSNGGTGTSSRGWRQVKFTVKKYEGKTARSQTLRITGINGNSGKKIYRDVIISVLPKQPIKVTCSPVRIPARKGESMEVSFKIPDGLIQSMFPLEFIIEADRMTLTPDLSENMPVTYNTSISLDDGFKDKQAFHFIRTLTWDDYCDYEKYPVKMEEDERLWRTITCRFKTNCDDNHAKVWVSNEYFILDENASASFENYDLKEFRNLAFLDAIPSAVGMPLNFAFEVTPDGTDGDGNATYPEITITLWGLTIDPENSPLESVSAGVYTYKPSARNVELVFYTTNNSSDIDDIRVTLEADDYISNYLEPYRFNMWLPDGSYVPKRSYGLLEGRQVVINNTTYWSNVSYGLVESGLQYGGNKKDRGVILGFYSDPHAPSLPKIKIKGKSGKALKSNFSDGSGLFAVLPTSYEDDYIPSYNVDGYKNYHEVILKTPTSGTPSYDPIEFYLEAPGYVTQKFTYNRLRKTRIHTYNLSIVTSGKTPNVGMFTLEDEETGALRYEYANNNDTNKEKTVDYSYFNLLIEPLDGAPAPLFADNSLYLGCDSETKNGPCVGGRYKLTFISGDIADYATDNNYKAQRFFSCFFTFSTNLTCPVSATPQDGDGVCHTFPGNTKMYHWIAYADASEYPGQCNNSDFPNYHPENWPQQDVTYSRSIILTAGTAHPIRIASFLYKALSEVR